MGKRDDILEATFELVNEYGYQNITIANVLKKASTGVGTLYNYFSSKDDLIQALYEEFRFKMGDDILSKVKDAEGVRPRFENFIIVYLNYCINNLDSINFTEQYGYYNRTNQYFAGRMDDRIFKYTHDIIYDGQKQKLIKPMKIELLMECFSGIVMYTAKGINSGHYEISEDEYEKIVDLCWDAIKA